jgi:uncharacterized membrane protein
MQIYRMARQLLLIGAMNITRKFQIVALLSGLAAPFACSPATSAVDCKAVTVPKYAAMTAWKKCTVCHASTVSGAARAGAPADINFDSYTDAVMDADRALSEVESGSMPPGGGLTADEKTQIIDWASCDTPQ